MPNMTNIIVQKHEKEILQGQQFSQIDRPQCFKESRH
jgi:hypothetical protein